MTAIFRSAALAALLCSSPHATAQTPGTMRNIDFVLPQQKPAERKERLLVAATVEKGSAGIDIARFRHRPTGKAVQRPARDIEIAILRQRLHYLPLPAGNNEEAAAVARVRHLQVSAAVKEQVSNGTDIALTWRAARLGNYNGTIMADNSKRYRHKTSDYFLPSVGVTVIPLDGLSLHLRHDESLRANLDTAVLGPRSMPIAQWMATGRQQDFERRTSNEFAMEWYVDDTIALGAQLGLRSYRDRLTGDERGLLQTLPGASRSTTHAAQLKWNPAPDLLIEAGFGRETITADSLRASSTTRNAWSIGIDRQQGSRRFSIHAGRQDVSHFDAAGLSFRPRWSLEASAEQAIAAALGLPAMTARLVARTAPRFDDGGEWNATSRDLAPQIRIDLSTRW